MPITSVTTHDTDTKIRTWIADGDEGDWIGVFENHDLGHPEVGRRAAALFGSEDWHKATVGRTNMPASPLDVGWRYILVLKTRDPQAAIDAMNLEVI